MADPDRARALALLRREGWNTTSFQVLEPGFRYWFDDDADAFVAYVDTGGAWVAGGAPVAPPARLAEVADRFVAAARAAGRRACFFAVEPRFVAATGYPALHVGEQPSWDPRHWDATVAGSRTLRAQLRRAARKGVVVRALSPAEVRDPDAPVRRAIDGLIARWQARRPMAPMGFLVDLQPFEFADERWHLVAEQDGRVVGFLAAVPIFARGGWFLEDLLRDHDAPNGTAELLVDAAMRRAAAAGATLVTLGLAPLAGPVPAPLRLAGVLGAPLYDFRGLRAFKAKLRPEAWSPVFLCAAPRASRWVALRDSLVAFARGSLVRFGAATLLRGPVGILWLLTLLLAVWIPLVALAPASWFPAPWIQAAWVGFDVALAIGLVALTRRYRAPLAIALALATSADAVLTAIEAAAHPPPIAPLLAAAVIAVSCGGPALATAALWGLVRQRGAVAG